jgi:hypothetical protein
MFRNGLLLAVLLFGCGVIPLHQASAGPRSQDTLRSFYVARFYSSDAIWDYPDQILDVTPEGDNVRGCGGHDCDNYFAWRLRGYTEAPKPYNPFAITLLNAASLHLVQYVSPIMPPIAGTAHVYGDVRLRIVADPKTGLAESAEFVSGPPLLARAAIAAAQRWQFAPESLPGQPLEATLRFALRCR